MTRARGFTLLELLVAMALFAVLGIAVVSLLGQGMTIFSEGTADNRIQDRLGAVLPPVRADLASMQPASAPEVLPPPVSDEAGSSIAPPVPPPPPAIRLRAGWVKLSDLPEDWPRCYYVALVRTNARESEDPLLRQAGSTPVSPGVPVRAYEPAVVDAATGSGQLTSLLAPGGLMEVVWIAIPEDPDPTRRAPPKDGPVVVGPNWSRDVLTLYRLFRAPAGGERTLLDPKNFDSIAKIRTAGRVMHEGVLHFGVTFRNVFARGWTDGVGTGRIEDGAAYVGPVWDSTRGLDRDFPLHKNADSLGEVRDDVFPAWAKIDLTLALEGEFGAGRIEALVAEPLAAGEKRLTLSSVDPLLTPGPMQRWLKVRGEWMSTSLDQIDVMDRRAVVARGQRGTKAVDHASSEAVFVGASVTTEVQLVYKDRYVPRSAR